MISGNEISIRKANAEEIDRIKKLVDQHKTELGFVIKSALLHSIERSELMVAVTQEGEIVGIVHYRHRRDKQTTLYNIAIASDFRRQAIATALVEVLKQEALNREQKFILLKCPDELEANQFYKAIGFERFDGEIGKHRRLALWRLRLVDCSDDCARFRLDT